MISSKTVSRLPPAVVSANNLLHPAANQTAIATAHRLLPVSLVRAVEVLLPPRPFSSLATKTDEVKDVDTSSKSVPVHRTFDSMFDHLWRTATDGFPFERNTQISKVFQDLDELTRVRNDRWMLSPHVKFPHIFDNLSPSLNVWRSAKYDEESKSWSLPIKVPNIFEENDLSVNIVKDKTNSYILRILGQHEVDNAAETKAKFDKVTGTELDTKKEPDTSKSDYHYKMEFQLPPLPSTDMTLEQAKEYYSPITAHFNKDEGTLMVKIPENIVSLKNDVVEMVEEEHSFSVPIESVA